jgi:hypothetical protein
MGCNIFFKVFCSGVEETSKTGGNTWKIRRMGWNINITEGHKGNGGDCVTATNGMGILTAKLAKYAKRED